ncbi:uncharacterized protein [Watersipora subatra]|uniref:uncharacterized protein n=1 Tax=Watersipora subatra TaxID=2589382 RepID=UPI00355B01B7
MGNKATRCCNGKSRPPPKNKPRRRKTSDRSDSDGSTSESSGMTPRYSALDILRADAAIAQSWLESSLAQLQALEGHNHGRPPDDKKRKKGAEKLKEFAKEFVKKSFETDELLSHSHAWLDRDDFTDTTFDLDIAKLEYSWSEVRDKLSTLASDFGCQELQADLAKDLSAQGGDGFSPISSSSYIPRSRLVNRRRTNPDGTQGHQPKHKRKFVPHLTWQYRAVIKSHVKYKDRTPRSSILGSDIGSESDSVYSEPLYSNRRLRDVDSNSSLSLPSVGQRHLAGSSSSLPTLSDAGKIDAAGLEELLAMFSE